MAAPAALLLVNSIPHLVAGITGRRFPTGFVGGPPNLDTPERNVVWGGISFLLGSLLLWSIADSLSNPALLIEMVVIAWIGAWGLARLFSRLP